MQALKSSNEPSLELDREIKREQRISALPIKLAYGGALGVAGTTIALRTLPKRYRVGERV